MGCLAEGGLGMYESSHLEAWGRRNTIDANVHSGGTTVLPSVGRNEKPSILPWEDFL